MPSCWMVSAASDGAKSNVGPIYEIIGSTFMTRGSRSTTMSAFVVPTVGAKYVTRCLGTSMTEKSRLLAQSKATSAGSSQRDRLRERNDGDITIVPRDAPRRRGKTDWARVDALTDEEIEEAVRNDPDAVPLDIDWSQAVLVVPPKKKAISIRVDEDVLDFFKQEGAGYQRRINAVLRSYMDQKRKGKKRA